MRTALDEAAKRGLTTRLEAASELVIAAIDGYAQVLDAAAQSEMHSANAAQLQEAGDTLAFVEFLWRDSRVDEIETASAGIEATSRLIGLVGHWLEWLRNDGEPPLRAHERRLALAAAKRCDDKSRLYENTDPFWNRTRLGDATSASFKLGWRDELRDILVGPIVEDLLGRFAVDDGLLTAASGNDKVAAWLIESPASHLHTDDILARDWPGCILRATATRDYGRC